MSTALENRLDAMENVRDVIITSLTKNGVDKLGEKELGLLEKTISNGAKIALSKAQFELNTQSEKGEEEFRKSATALLRAQREESNRRAQAHREAMANGQVQAMTGGAIALPTIEARPLQPNEGLQGQHQIGYDVLSGAKAFDPTKTETPRPERTADSGENP